MLLAVVLLALGGPASAYSTLDTKSVTANTDVTVTIEAPVEALRADNEKLIVEVPDGFHVLRCGGVDDFSCTQSTVEGPHRTWLTWQRTTRGKAPSVRADHFPFRMHTIEQPGKYVFVLHQFYSDGRVDDSGSTVQVTPGESRSATTTSTVASTSPTPKRGVGLTASVAAQRPVEDPVWVDDAYAGATDQAKRDVELGTESVPKTAPRMIAIGVVTAFAAGGVFWLRRRAGPEF
jgi:hypothetical protein